MTMIRALFVAALMFGCAGTTAAQHMIAPSAAIEQRMREMPFKIISWTGSRMPTDRTQRVGMQFDDSVTLVAKWAVAPRSGGGTFNNEPRYEVAAYEIQKLFLTGDEHVVPPTVLRVFPLAFMTEQIKTVERTFGEAPASVLVVLQYWLSMVTPTNFWDRNRVETDTAYARAIGNFNILTYLIRHGDANAGNYLISSSETLRPRVFAVDNGVGFGQLSNRGYDWKDIRVNRLPRETVDRLRTVDRAALDMALGTLVEYRVEDGALVPAERSANMNVGRGVRRSADRIQIGLTRVEINRVEDRLRDLLKKVDNGEYKVF